MSRRVHIRECATDEDYLAAADLFREYAASLPQSAQISLAHQGFETELAGLPGKYAQPTGCILLAVSQAGPLATGEPIGVVALRPLDPTGVLPGDTTPICEMKRMYVSPRARGLGAGRLLAIALLAYARKAGYGMMKLDTEPDFIPAVTLYRSLGFVDVPRYNDDPVSCTLWMGMKL